MFKILAVRINPHNNRLILVDTNEGRYNVPVRNNSISETIKSINDCIDSDQFNQLQPQIAS